MSLTLSALVRWKQGFTVLSMERCLNFSKEMGLPPKIIADSKAIVSCARSHLRKMSRMAPTPSESPEAYIESVQHSLDDAFSEIARSYNQDTAKSLRDWFVRYIVDDDHIAALALWREFFRRACGPVETAESTFSAPFDDNGMKRLCSVVRISLTPERMRQTRQRIREARSLALSEWELWLEEEVARAAGEGQMLGAVEMALDLVENVVNSHRTVQACQSLRKDFSLSERNRLVEWASHQAFERGFARSVLHELAASIS